MPMIAHIQFFHEWVDLFVYKAFVHQQMFIER